MIFTITQRNARPTYSWRMSGMEHQRVRSHSRGMLLHSSIASQHHVKSIPPSPSATDSRHICMQQIPSQHMCMQQIPSQYVCMQQISSQHTCMQKQLIASQRFSCNRFHQDPCVTDQKIPSHHSARWMASNACTCSSVKHIRAAVGFSLPSSRCSPAISLLAPSFSVGVL